MCIVSKITATTATTATKPEKSLLKSLNVKSSPIHENKSTFLVAMSDIIVPTIQLLVVVT